MLRKHSCQATDTFLGYFACNHAVERNTMHTTTIARSSPAVVRYSDMPRQWREQVIHLGPATDLVTIENIRSGILDGSLALGQPAHLVAIGHDGQFDHTPLLRSDGIDTTEWTVGERWLRYQHQSGQLFRAGQHEIFGDITQFALGSGVPVSSLCLLACDSRSPIPADWLSRDQVQLFLHLRR